MTAPPNTGAKSGVALDEKALAAARAAYWQALNDEAGDHPGIGCDPMRAAITAFCAALESAQPSAPATAEVRGEVGITADAGSLDNPQTFHMSEPPAPAQGLDKETEWPIGTHVHIDHDGFSGTVIGHYQRQDGYQGCVLQQDGSKVVHVYGLRHLRAVEGSPMSDKASIIDMREAAIDLARHLEVLAVADETEAKLVSHRDYTRWSLLGKAKAYRNAAAQVRALPLPPVAGWKAPEGWQLVPIEPDPIMLGAWYRYKNGHHFADEPVPKDTSDYGAYRAMLAKAPTPPASTEAASCS